MSAATVVSGAGTWYRAIRPISLHFHVSIGYSCMGSPQLAP